ncbi:hypothetical protein SDC9_64508 [bioreactor metagenome]|uniref:Uncharacterized protein n=1 Tax=bioreactor metagenome TaxID=1076179 RepID=A0A644XPH0_9ZZZZ
MFGKKAKRIAELERELEECQAMRNTFEFSLIRAREGMDEETNAFFRAHPVYVEPEQMADTGTTRAMAKKPSKKAK